MAQALLGIPFSYEEISENFQERNHTPITLWNSIFVWIQICCKKNFPRHKKAIMRTSTTWWWSHKACVSILWNYKINLLWRNDRRGSWKRDKGASFDFSKALHSFLHYTIINSMRNYGPDCLIASWRVILNKFPPWE